MARSNTAPTPPCGHATLVPFQHSENPFFRGYPGVAACGSFFSPILNGCLRVYPQFLQLYIFTHALPPAWFPNYCIASYEQAPLRRKLSSILRVPTLNPLHRVNAYTIPLPSAPFQDILPAIYIASLPAEWVGFTSNVYDAIYTYRQSLNFVYIIVQ